MVGAPNRRFDMNQRDVMTGRELAERLRVSPDTIRHWARIGRIPVLKYSPRVQRFDFRSVLAALGDDVKGGRRAK